MRHGKINSGKNKCKNLHKKIIDFLEVFVKNCLLENYNLKNLS